MTPIKIDGKEYVLVPVEPTEEMFRNLEDGLWVLRRCDDELNGREVWEVVLDTCSRVSPPLDPATVERCAEIARKMRDEFGRAIGDNYSMGLWDQGVRIELRIRALLEGKEGES